MIAIGADMLEGSSVSLATMAGIPTEVVGVTVVALCTSLPELVTAITALAKGHGALSLTGNLGAKEKVHALMPEVHFFPYPYSYRCPFGLGGEAGTRACCEYFERTLKDPESGITRPAAVILEPIQGEGGVIPQNKEYVQAVAQLCAEQDILLIVLNVMVLLLVSLTTKFIKME